MADEAADGDGGGSGRPSTLSLVAGAIVVAVAVVVGGALVVSSDIGDVISGRDRHELDVALVGDSFADQARAGFLELAEEHGLDAEVFAYGGTAICGWNDQLRRLARREPDVLVLSFAGNDLQPCINPARQTRAPETVAADYGRQLEGVLEMFRSTGTDLYVVEPPPIRDAEYEARAAAMRELYRRMSLDHPRIDVIETEDRLGPDGEFHAALPCQEGEEGCRPDGTVVLRQSDGIHLTPAGGRRYAQAVFDVLER
ncbi:MAG TPA: GDSL-type esterase/lipase family protein [Acidimicrobiales bacterium]